MSREGQPIPSEAKQPHTWIGRAVRRLFEGKRYGIEYGGEIYTPQTTSPEPYESRSGSQRGRYTLEFGGQNNIRRTLNDLPNEIGMATALVDEVVPQPYGLTDKDLPALDAAIDTSIREGLGYLYQAAERQERSADTAK